jgi:hypothetical protein
MLFVTTPGKNICYIALVRIISGYQLPVGGIIFYINTKYQGQTWVLFSLRRSTWQGIKLALGVNDHSHIGYS